MEARRVRHGGRARRVDPEWALRLKQSDPAYWTDQRIAEYISEETGTPITRQGVSGAIKAYLKAGGQVPSVSARWPWGEMLPEHRTGPLYDMVSALQHWEEGHPLSEAEEAMVAAFRPLLDTAGMVVSYHRESGIVFVTRRTGEESYFQVRAFGGDGQPILG